MLRVYLVFDTFVPTLTNVLMLLTDFGSNNLAIWSHCFLLISKWLYTLSALLSLHMEST